MKKFTYLATLLLVMAGAVSCEKKAGVNDPTPQPTGEMRQVTITAGQGAERTSVSNGNLTWSAGDKLYIAPVAGGFDAAALNIVSGVGEASATFKGSIDSGIADDTELYGWAGGAWTYTGEEITINMSEEQTYVENGLAENAYPSIGAGSIESGISLQNPFGVLCLNVKGETTDIVNSITITSADNYLAGVFTLDLNETSWFAGGSSKTITLNCTTNVALATDGVKFYIVVPAASYVANDLIVTVTTSDDRIFDVTLGATTVTAGSATTIDISASKWCKNCLYTETVTDICGNKYNLVTIGEQTWMAENMRCIRYDSGSEKSGTTLSTSSKNTMDPYYTPTRSQDPVAYGYLYNWAAAMGYTGTEAQGQIGEYSGTRQGICPNGFHIPSRTELGTLATAAGSGPGKHLKVCDGWNNNGNGDNETCFAALPAGAANGSSVVNVGDVGSYWSSYADNNSKACGFYLYAINDNFSEYSYAKVATYSVRCLKVKD